MKWKHYIIVLVGLITFVLLLFADKTNLNNDSEREVTVQEDMPTRIQPSRDLISRIPPLVSDNTLDSLQNALKNAEEVELKLDLLRKLVEYLQVMNRLDAAAIYAGQLAQLEKNVKNLLVAGALHRVASSMPTIAEDTSLYRTFSNSAIALLEEATRMEPENEDVMIELGLAYVESPQPQNSMKGILTLVKVLEINPENEEAALRLGIFSQQTGQFDKAIERFQQVLNINPDNIFAKYYLANLFLEAGQQDKAIPLLNQLSAQQKDEELASVAKSILEQITSN